MLNFSKIKVALIYLFFIFLSIFVLLNFQNKDERLVDRQVNLGLDLQGGSYLLLEIDTDPLIIERLQSKVIPIKKFLSENSIEYNNFQIKKDKISWNSSFSQQTFISVHNGVMHKWTFDKSIIHEKKLMPACSLRSNWF